jgi:hypothetical protein
MPFGMRSASLLWSTASSLVLGALAVVLSCGREGPAEVRDGAAARGPARRDDRGPSPALRSLQDADAGAQDRTPVDQLQLVLDGFAALKRDIPRLPEEQQQARTFHYCAELNPDFMQCVIFDGSDAGAHLTGVEYVISEALYATLPVEERQYWHAHLGEVDSGILIAPGIAQAAHDRLMTQLRGTYGKTWRAWDTRRDILPFGDPALMWAIPPGKIGATTRAAMQARRESQ